MQCPLWWASTFNVEGSPCGAPFTEAGTHWTKIACHYTGFVNGSIRAQDEVCSVALAVNSQLVALCGQWLHFLGWRDLGNCEGVVVSTTHLTYLETQIKDSNAHTSQRIIKMDSVKIS